MRKIEREVKCGCCGKEIKVEDVLSMYIKDSGLDQKPLSAEFLVKINECPHCHYCSPDIENTISEDMKAIVFSEKYQEIMKSPGKDPEGRKIKAAIKISENNFIKIHLYLTLCWHLEFQGEMQRAEEIRKRAVSAMEEELEGEPSVELVLVYIDCLRQLGEFTKCRSVMDEIQDILYENLDEKDFLIKLFMYEKKLVEKLDKEPHLASEI